MRFIYTKTFTRLFTVFVIVAAFIILDRMGYLNWFLDRFNVAYGQAVSETARVTDSIRQGFQTVFTIKNLARDNAQLSQQVDQLAFENARLKSAGEENVSLRKALGLKQNSEFNLLAVESLTLDPTGFAQQITINHGQSAGLKLNQPVVVAPGILVGRITRLFADSAEVTLLTDPSTAVNAEVADSGARGLIRGEHGLSLLFDLITQDEVVKSGDSIITSGLSGDLPRGLLIGQITSLQSAGTDLFQKAYVTPAADLRDLRFLFVIQGP
jgi:rod shape-determining protein MreC